MSYYVYIIYSEKLQKFYTGISEDLQKRLDAHLKGISDYTKKSSDWVLIWNIILPTKRDALRLERKIKKRGAKRYLDDIGFRDVSRPKPWQTRAL